MTTFVINPCKLNASSPILVPPSKSHTHRALIFGMMGKGKSQIKNPLISPDTQGMIDAIERLGARVEKGDNALTIQGGFSAPKEQIDAHNSGLILRLLTALGALLDQPIQITGDESIQTKRPILPLLDALNQLGAQAKTIKNNGFAPLSVCGPITNNTCFLNGEDSQFVSALLIAGSFCKNRTHIEVQNPKETPWIDLTLEWLRRLGANVTHQDYQSYQVEGGLSYDGFSYQVPGDFSSSAFLMGSALVTNSFLEIEGLDMNDTQGDKILINLLKKMGAKISYENGLLKIAPSSLRAISIDADTCIDAVPILAVLGCFATGTTHIYNAKGAKNKESNRIAAMGCELKKMGGNIDATNDGLIIKKSTLFGAQVHSYNDHRIALALAIAGFGASFGTTYVEDAACFAKTYPSFVRQMKKIGASIELDLLRV